eukprot:SAG31_NODE_1590_length_7805_cov_3.417390_6_plen_54_part_00
MTILTPSADTADDSAVASGNGDYYLPHDVLAKFRTNLADEICSVTEFHSNRVA